MLVIGYQGIVFSHTYDATLKYLDRERIDNYELVGLIEPKKVLDYIAAGKIDLGVIAWSNTLGGIVKQSQSEVTNYDLELMHEFSLKISHSLFCSPNVSDHKKIKRVVSHPQALKQCSRKLESLLGSFKKVKASNTATAARDLSFGHLKDSDAVICSKLAGESYKLRLIQDEIEDSGENYTTFRVYKTAQS